MTSLFTMQADFYTVKLTKNTVNSFLMDTSIRRALGGGPYRSCSSLIFFFHF